MSSLCPGIDPPCERQRVYERRHAETPKEGAAGNAEPSLFIRQEERDIEFVPAVCDKNDRERYFSPSRLATFFTGFLCFLILLPLTILFQPCIKYCSHLCRRVTGTLQPDTKELQSLGKTLPRSSQILLRNSSQFSDLVTHPPLLCLHQNLKSPHLIPTLPLGGGLCNSLRCFTHLHAVSNHQCPITASLAPKSSLPQTPSKESPLVIERAAGPYLNHLILLQV
mmetsp:Transcript_21922/g.43505  ORF Transcript_21922/g.43505 Transcript_21922/m.43505 type:complete len:224 (-) Transcript_21922:54-725(-)